MSNPRQGKQKAVTHRNSRGSRPPTRIDWRDPSVWLAVVLLVAVGFGAAYGLWLRTWRLDIAREQDWYLAAGLLRLRDFRARAEALFNQRTPDMLSLLTASAARLDGSLGQIPRRGPVQWRAEMIGFTAALHDQLTGALERQIETPDPTVLAELADQMPSLRDKILILEEALDATVLRPEGGGKRLNFTPEVEAALIEALAAAKSAAEELPQ